MVRITGFSDHMIWNRGRSRNSEGLEWGGKDLDKWFVPSHNQVSKSTESGALPESTLCISLCLAFTLC